jgi:hypothetical protein
MHGGNARDLLEEDEAAPAAMLMAAGMKDSESR